MGSLQHHQQCTEELLRVKARRAAAPMGVSSAAQTGSEGGREISGMKLGGLRTLTELKHFFFF